MNEVVSGVLLLALVPLVWLLMLRSWRRGAARQGAVLPAPDAVADAAWVADGPSVDDAARARTVTGTYVSTVLAGQPLQRVTAHGLGTRSLVELEADPAGRLVLRRSGAASFSVPAADLEGVHRSRGQAGKVMFGKEDLVVVTWRLGGTAVETAVRTKPQQDADRLVALVEGLLVRPGGADGSSGRSADGSGTTGEAA